MKTTKTQKTTSIYILLILVSLGMTGAKFFFSNSMRDEDNRNLDQMITELSSKKSGSRTTPLGKVLPKVVKNQKEVQVLLKDPAMSQSWGLKTTDAQRAWRLTTGSKSIVVAIVDTGIDVTHPDLAANLWTNPGESGLDENGKDKATNGKDDDNNGYIDDVHGWNFVNNNNILTDNHGHGTHIAGIIGAVGGNGIGISGISPKVSLMALKYYDPKASGLNNLLNTVKAIQYAVSKNVNIINYSGGGLEPSSEEKRAIELAQKKGILFVAAAGNERSNSDIKGYYPADYGLSNVISVTAIDINKTILPSSNYGEKSVDIAAPGHDIYSTLPNGQYGYLTGTSQATAFVSGVAALVMANNSELKSANRIVKYLTQTGDTVASLNGKTRYHKVLNSYKALAIQDSDLSINGVRVENTLHMSANTFSTESTKTPVAHQKTKTEEIAPETVIASFGKALQKAVSPHAQSSESTTPSWSTDQTLPQKSVEAATPYPDL